MSRRAFVPQTIYEAERPIKREQSSFNQGMITDGEARDVGNGALAHAVRNLYNVRGYRDCIQGAPGTSLLTGGDIAVTITDDLQTISQSMAAGEIYAANGNVVPAVGDIIEVRGTGDFTGNNLATAKGEVPRPYDYFEITNATYGFETVTYLGNLRVPAMPGFGNTVATELTCTKLNKTISRVSGPSFTSALVNHFLCWPDGHRDLITAYNSANELTVDESGYYAESAGCKVYGRMYASYNFKLYNVIVVQCYNRLYVSDGIPITGWKEIPLINSNRPSLIFGRFSEENQNLILTNGNGHYRIVFNEYNVDPYAYKLNEAVPTARPLGLAPTAANGYRITYSMSRIVAPSYTMDRTDGVNGATLQHESPTLGIDKMLGSDYTEVWLANAIGATTPYLWEGFYPPAALQHYTHYSLYRTKNINANSIAAGNKKDLFVWHKDVPVLKSFVCSRNASGVITATSGTFDPEDIGNDITFADGTTDTIISYTSTTEVQGMVTSGKTSQAAALGGSTVFAISQTGKTITITGKSLAAGDTGKQIFVSNGKIIFITEVLTTATALVHTSDTYSNLGGTMDPETRHINDLLPDETLQTRIESGSTLYFLQSRFFQPLPNTNLGVINGGQYVVAISGENRYYYCNTSKEQLVGFYHPEKMKNEKITDGIQQLRSYQGKIIIRCTNSTWVLITSTSAAGGDSTLGEQYTVVGDPEILTDTIGVIGDTSSKTLANGQELVWTTEPALRVFDGFSYGENLAANIMDILRLFMPDVKISYSPSDGVHFWGDQEV